MAERKLQITIETVARGQAVVKKMTGDYASLAQKVVSETSRMQAAQAKAAKAVEAHSAKYSELGKRADAAEAKVAKLTQQLTRASSATLPVNDFLKLDRALESAQKNAEKLRAAQTKAGQSVSLAQRDYERLAQSMNRARAVGDTLASSQVSRWGSVRNAVDRARQGIEAFVRKQQEANRTQVSPPIKFDASSIVGGMTRAVALGTIFANLITGAARTFNFGGALAGQGLQLTANLERTQMSLEELVVDEIIAANTETKRVRIGTRQVGVNEQLIAQYGSLEKAQQAQVNATLDLERAQLDLESAQLRVAETQNDLDENAKTKKQTDANFGIEQQRNALDYRYAVLGVSEAQNDLTKAQVESNKNQPVTPKTVALYREETKQLISDVEARKRAVVAAKDLLKFSKELAIASPFNRDNVLFGIQYAKVTGFNVDQSKRLVKATTDFASANGLSGVELQNVIIALGQVRQAGRLMGQETLQLLSNRVPIFDILSKVYGKAPPELRKMMEKGQLESTKVIEAVTAFFEKRFGGAAERQSETLTGLFASLSDLKDFTIEDIFAGFGAAIKPALKDLVDILKSPGFSEAARNFGTTLGNMVKPIGNVLKAVQGFQAGLELFGDPIDALRSGLLNLFGPDITREQIAGADKLRDTLKDVRTAITSGDLGGALQTLLDGLNINPAKIAEDFRTRIKGFGDGLAAKVKEEKIPEKIGQAIRDGVGLAVGTVPEFVAAALKGQAGPISDSVGGVIPLVGESILRILNGALTVLTQGLAALLREVSKALSTGLAALGGDLAVGFVDAVFSPLGEVKALFKEKFGVDLLPQIDIEQIKKDNRAYYEQIAKDRNAAIEAFFNTEINKITERGKVRDEAIKGAFLGAGSLLDEKIGIGQAKQQVLQLPVQIQPIAAEGLGVDKLFDTTKLLPTPESQTQASQQIGNAIATGIVAGVQAEVENTRLAIEAYANGFVTSVKNVLGIRSPSQVMADQVGQPTAEGISVGFAKEASKNELARVASLQAMAIHDVFKQNNWAQIGTDIIGGIVKGLKGGAYNLYATIAAIIEGAMAAAKDTLETGSPSRRTERELGVPFMQGISRGVEAETPTAIGSVQRALDSMFLPSTPPQFALAGAQGGQGGGTSIVFNEPIYIRSESDLDLLVWRVGERLRQKGR